VGTHWGQGGDSCEHRVFIGTPGFENGIATFDRGCRAIT
jgi:hypothetical protein